MKQKIQYLSFGGGVNSTALLLLLTDRCEQFETIFVNHGGDYPVTYEYVDYLRDEGFEITEITPNVEGYHTIYDYSIQKQILPSRRFRWCSDKFKIRPINSYIELPCTMFIGFDKGELKRVVDNRLTQITNEYPLVDAGMDRNDCIDIIIEHGLKVPQKSGCWFCPFMHKLEVRELFLNHHDLYNKTVALENNCMKEGFYIKNKPLPEIAMADTSPSHHTESHSKNSRQE